MKSIVSLLFLLSTVYSAHTGYRDYHKEIGIPLATKIKKLESEIIAKGGLNSGRISGGSVIDILEVPYQAAVVIEAPVIHTFSLCGGALISSTRVLTAAHCEYDQGTYTVGLGSNFAFYGGQRVNGIFISHPGYSQNDPNILHDIAILHIPAVSFSDVVQPISLPNQDEVSNNFVGYTALASGYGIRPEALYLDFNQLLRAVESPVISPAECGATFGVAGSRVETICISGAGGVGVCSSDSGGPLATVSNNRRILIGITSYGGYCGGGFPSGFVRITQYLSWILSN